MRNTLILFGAVGAIALGSVAQAQVLGGGLGGGVGGVTGGVSGGLTGQVTAPDVPTDRVTDTARRGVDTTRRTARKAKAKAESGVERARGAADDATDASARAAAGFAAGTRVQDSNGADIGKVIGADGSGYVRVQTRNGVISLPSAALRMNGGVAVSSQTEADLRASGSTRID